MKQFLYTRHCCKPVTWIILTSIGIFTILIHTQGNRHRELTFHSGSNLQTQEPGNQHRQPDRRLCRLPNWLPHLSWDEFSELQKALHTEWSPAWPLPITIPITASDLPWTWPPCVSTSIWHSIYMHIAVYIWTAFGHSLSSMQEDQTSLSADTYVDWRGRVRLNTLEHKSEVSGSSSHDFKATVMMVRIRCGLAFNREYWQLAMTRQKRSAHMSLQKPWFNVRNPSRETRIISKTASTFSLTSSVLSKINK